MRAAVPVSDGDDGFPSSVSLVGIAEGLLSLVQRVRIADDRCHLAGFDEVLQEQEVLAAVDRGQGAQLLTEER
jgi:hypothetical protein